MPGVQRERHRDQVRASACARGRGRRLRAKRSEHPVEQLEVRRVRVQDRLRRAGRARRPHHERDAGVVRAARVTAGDPVGPDDRGGIGRVEHACELRVGIPRIHRNEHASREPYRGHGGDDIGTVREGDRYRGSGSYAEAPQLVGTSPGRGARVSPAVTLRCAVNSRPSSSANGWSISSAERNTSHTAGL